MLQIIFLLTISALLQPIGCQVWTSLPSVASRTNLLHCYSLNGQAGTFCASTNGITPFGSVFLSYSYSAVEANLNVSSAASCGWSQTCSNTFFTLPNSSVCVDSFIIGCPQSVNKVGFVRVDANMNDTYQIYDVYRLNSDNFTMNSNLTLSTAAGSSGGNFRHYYTQLGNYLGFTGTSRTISEMLPYKVIVKSGNNNLVVPSWLVNKIGEFDESKLGMIKANKTLSYSLSNTFVRNHMSFDSTNNWVYNNSILNLTFYQKKYPTNIKLLQGSKQFLLDLENIAPIVASNVLGIPSGQLVFDALNNQVVLVPGSTGDIVYPNNNTLINNAILVWNGSTIYVEYRQKQLYGSKINPAIKLQADFSNFDNIVVDLSGVTLYTYKWLYFRAMIAKVYSNFGNDITLQFDIDPITVPGTTINLPAKGCSLNSIQANIYYYTCTSILSEEDVVCLNHYFVQYYCSKLYLLTSFGNSFTNGNYLIKPFDLSISYVYTPDAKVSQMAPGNADGEYMYVVGLKLIIWLLQMMFLGFIFRKGNWVNMILLATLNLILLVLFIAVFWKLSYWFLALQQLSWIFAPMVWNFFRGTGKKAYDNLHEEHENLGTEDSPRRLISTKNELGFEEPVGKPSSAKKKESIKLVPTSNKDKKNELPPQLSDSAIFT